MLSLHSVKLPHLGVALAFHDQEMLFISVDSRICIQALNPEYRFVTFVCFRESLFANSLYRFSLFKLKSLSF